MQLNIEIFDDDGDSITVNVPARWHICGACEGHGKSSAYLGAYTASEMDEQGPEFREDYMAGRYDRPCEECKGSGKVQEIDRDRCDAEILKQLDDAAKEEADYRRLCEAERRMGA